MRPYHPANLKVLPYAPWRVIALAWFGKLLGIQFKIYGFPYGGRYRPELWGRTEGDSVPTSFAGPMGVE